MINIQVTDTGFVRDSLDTILDNLKAAAVQIFGSDTDFSPSNPDTQLLGAFAEAINDTASAVEAVYNGRNPDVATGQNLAATCRLNNVDRVLGSLASVNLTVVITSGATVPAGTLVSDPTSGAVYAFDVDTVGTGAEQVTSATATVEGMTSEAGNVNNIVTPTYGLISVRNDDPASGATARETDEQLRYRRSQSTATPSSSLVDSLQAGLMAVPGIGAVRIWENSTGVWQNAKTDNLALPPHSVSVVAKSGAAAAIGEAIYTRKSLGCTTAGDQLVVVSDSAGNPCDIRFRYATEMPVYMRIEYSARAGQGFGAAGGEDAVKAALVEWAAANFQIGENVYLAHLYPPILAAVTGIDGRPAFTIENIAQGRSPNPTSSGDLATDFDELPTLELANIAMVAV